MPYDEADPSDPNVLVGVVMPGESGSAREMAYVLAEEFARMGYDRAMILSMFRNPFYAGAHGPYATLGEGAVVTIVEECLNVWGRVRRVDHVTLHGGDDFSKDTE